MSWWSELLFNAGTGGLFGLFGSVATSVIRIWEKKQDNKFALDMLDKQAASAEALAAWNAFAASQSASASDMTEKVAPWAANVRAVTRPFLTIGLVLGSFTSFFLIEDQYLKVEAIQSFMMLAGTSVAWWFGSRMTSLIRK
jgi:hypothetical protein